jgi:hypothetical protein
VPAQINHFFVLMMENRSLDHMLGFMKGPGYDIEGLDPGRRSPITRTPLKTRSLLRTTRSPQVI